MRGAWLSILGLYNYDNTIFDGLTLPTTSDLPGLAEYMDDIIDLDKDTLVKKLLFDLAELPLVYTDPATMKSMIEVWSDSREYNWVMTWETMLYKYNPIWNKDGTFTETRNSHKNTSSTSEMDGTVTDSGSNGNTRTFNTQNPTSSTISHEVTGFDTNTYSPSTRDSGSGTNNQTGTISDAGTNGNTRTYDTLQTDRGNSSESGGVTRTERGNIGITSSQELVTRQRDLVLFNLYDHIIDDFKNQFCIMIY